MRKILFAGLLCCSVMATAQVSVPKYVNEFLSIGQGARGLGMGNTQAAIVNDATSGYWNPAGLMRVQDRHAVSLMHSENFAGIVQNDYIAYAGAYDSTSKIGLSVIRVGVDDIPNTLNLIDDNGVIDYDRITGFGVSDYAFIGSYAKRSNLLDGLVIGVNGKIIYRHVGPFANAWGFGMDVGAQWERKGWLLGLMARDITTTSTYWTYNTGLLEDVFLQTGNEIPQNSVEVALPRFVFGVAREFMVRDKVSVLASADLDITTDGRRNVLLYTNPISFDPHAGVEVGYKRIVFLRGGFNNLQREKNFSNENADLYDNVWVFQPNFGIGLNVKKISIDYALTRMATQNDGLYSHIFSVNFAIN